MFILFLFLFQYNIYFIEINIILSKIYLSRYVYFFLKEQKLNIFHISDLHFNPSDIRGIHNIDKVLQDIEQYKQKGDLLVVTGDIINRDFDDYAPVFDKFKQLDIPFFCITGNHDKSTALISALKQLCPNHPLPASSDKLDYVCDDFPFKIIALDSYAENLSGGALSDKQLAFLETEVEKSLKPVVVLVHQFCINGELFFFDKTNRQPWTDKFSAIVAKYPNKIKLVLSGHLHNSAISNVNGVTFISSFSANWQANLDFVPVENMKNANKPVGYYIHTYNGKRFVSYAVPL